MALSSNDRRLIALNRSPRVNRGRSLEVGGQAGVAVMLEARHLCMEMRGIRKPGRVETRIVRGALTEPRWAAVLPAAQGAVASGDE